MAENTPMKWKKQFREKIRYYQNILERENIPLLLKLIGVFTLISAGLIVFFEAWAAEANITNFVDGIWWSFVTMTTVGYGDHYPTTHGGKILATFLMFSGIALSSFFTATISSIFVDQRIKEGRGLETIKSKNHLVICGWNQHTGEVLTGISQNLQAAQFSEIVLVGNLSEELYYEIKERYSSLKVRYVRGNFSHDAILKRSNVKNAAAVVIFSDAKMDPKMADDTTILTTLAIKSTNSKVKVIAELNQSANVTHLKRANVDEIILNGEFNGYLLCSATYSPGISEFIRALLKNEDSGGIAQRSIGNEFVGQPFRNLYNHFRDSHQEILIGILSRVDSPGLDAMLGTDSSAIDAFIKLAFERSGKEIPGGKKGGLESRLNPPDDYIIQKNDTAIAIPSNTGGRA